MGTMLSFFNLLSYTNRLWIRALVCFYALMSMQCMLARKGTRSLDLEDFFFGFQLCQ